ncbi:MAG: DUF4351 domain-containing protein [Cyanobacteria bacterium P01_H01_bin.121]
MLDLKTADVRQTRFYQEVFQEGQQEGEVLLVIRLFTQRFQTLSKQQEEQIRKLSLVKLESLGAAMFDFSEAADLNRWLEQNT